MLKRLLVNAANLKKFTEFTAQILQFIREYLKGNYQIFSDPRTEVEELPSAGRRTLHAGLCNLRMRGGVPETGKPERQGFTGKTC